MCGVMMTFGKCHSGTLGRQGLRVHHIQPRAGDAGRVPSAADEIRGHRASAATDVEEVRARLHGREEGLVEDAGGLRGERRAVDDEVRFRGELEQLIRQPDLAHVVRAVCGRSRG